MSRQLKEDLEKIYDSLYVIEEKQSMTVGSTPVGDLPGATKKAGPKGSGSESTDADAAEEAPESLQGDTVEDSKKKKGGTTSKFEELFKSVVSEQIDDSTIEDDSFKSEIGDFPPAGQDEEAAERLGDTEEPKSLSELFAAFADVATQIGDKYAEEEGGVEEGEVISDETELGMDEEITGEAVESTPAPDGVSKHTAKASQNVGGVKVVKKKATAQASGQEDGGKPKDQPDSTLGPDTSLKANGSGAAVDGKDVSAFE